MDFEEGPGYVAQSPPHYIENVGDTDLLFLEMFKAAHYEDISLAEWMAHTPHQLIDQHLHVGMVMIDAIPKDEIVIHPSMSLPNRIGFCARRLEGHGSPCRLRVTRMTAPPQTFQSRS